MMKKSILLLFLFISSMGYAQLNLPVDFESTTIDYGLTDFGGDSSAIVVDPTDASNMVAMTTKSATAQSWAGTTVGGVGGTTGFDTPIPFSSGNTTMTVRVWAPMAGMPVRLKVENSNDPTVTVETEVNTTVANAWDTLTFDFSNQAPGTAALNFASSYNKASIFFNFGTDGATAGGPITCYWDDMQFGGSSTPSNLLNLPVTFDDSTLDYGLTDFGGDSSAIVVDPTDASNMVAMTTKSATAQSWAGTTVGGTGGTTGFATPIPFSAGNTTMKVRVWAPMAGMPVRLKVEDASNAGISVETEVNTTVANAWDTLTFDFSNQAAGTAAINFANTYNKASIFFNFGTDGATAGGPITCYWDDMRFVNNSTPPNMLNLPVTFDDSTLDYGLTDFGGDTSAIVVDPTDASNMVAMTTKSATAQSWAGTTVGGTVGFATPIPFSPGNATMTVRVWAPMAGMPVRLKVEDASNAGISVETEVNTTVANAWDTLTFNFANEAPGTAPINYTNTYNKASIFFNFGTDGATAGGPITCYWDDMQFVDNSVTNMLNLPVTFDDSTLDYGLTDFGGDSSAIVVDPTDASNMVAMTTKSATAQSWAGTTVGGTLGFATPVPFSPGNTTMTVRVWAPMAGMPVRLKVENANDPTITVETEVNTTVANAWETLTFDFSNEAPGTAALNFANTYNKASIFFNFGTDGATAGGPITCYWDDMQFGSTAPPNMLNLPVTFEDSTLDYGLTDFGGDSSAIVVDPTDATNMVAMTTKSATAQSWAGTTVGGTVGFATPIPFSSGNTTMSVRVWAPMAGMPVRLKVEDASNAGISVETEVNTTVANAWETLNFDFSNEAPGTAPINFANTYNKASIFFNFGTDGATAGGPITCYWDDMQFGAASTPTTVYDLIAGDSDLSTLKTAIDAAGLNTMLSGNGPFTLFAPTNEAFAAIPPALLAQAMADPTGLLHQIDLYHMLNSEMMSTDFTAGQLTTIEGEDVTVSFQGSDLYINNAMVTTADMTADNGVVHIINAVLIPPSVSGLPELSSNPYISVGPNPARDYVTVNFKDGKYQGVDMKLYNISGKLVGSYKANSTSQQIATSTLAAGQYFLRIDTPKSSYFKKLVITR